MRSFITPALLTFGCLLSACGGSEIWLFGLNRTVDKSESDYKYEFSVNGCSTGEHRFDSKEDYCKGLLDEDLNNGCAVETRQKLHESECK